MKVLCAWCEKEMGKKEPLWDTSTTHGICPKCLKELKEELGKSGSRRRDTKQS